MVLGFGPRSSALKQILETSDLRGERTGHLHNQFSVLRIPFTDEEAGLPWIIITSGVDTSSRSEEDEAGILELGIKSDSGLAIYMARDKALITS